MIRDRFAFHAPTSLAEAVELLGSGSDDTEILGGGTWVVPEMTQGVRRPRRVVDLRRAGLSGIGRENGTLVVGATATYAQVAASPQVGEAAPLLATMARGITGGPQLRNVGTLGGSAVFATPSSDVPGALTGLRATFHLESASGGREVPAEDFFVDAFRADVREDEVLAEVRIPAAAPRVRQGYYKLKLCESSWPIVTAACALEMGDDGTCMAVRLALGGAQPTPLVVDVDAALLGSAPTAEAAGAVEEIVRAAMTDPWSDTLADGDYRRQVAGVVAKRAVLAAADEEG